MPDLTIIYLTTNKMPQRWVEFHREHLLRAIGDRPMVVISANEMDWGRKDTKYLRQQEPFSAWNVYVQLYNGVCEARTPFIAVAEDDTLYTKEHFRDFRPRSDEVAYDMARWSVFSWQERPMFSMIRKRGNFTMIGPRELVVDALAERMHLHPEATPDLEKRAGEIGRPDVERRLRVTRRKAVEFYARKPIVNLAHPQGLSPTYIGHPTLKRAHGEMRAYEIPHWGKAADITEIYNQGIREEQDGATTADPA